MRPPPAPPRNRLTAYFYSGDTLRSRSVGGVVLHGTVEVPAPPVRLLADWERDIALHLHLEPGDVDTLPLGRARMRWPDHPRCVQAVADWLRRQGMPDLLPGCDTALMACRGARYHHDGAQYAAAAFCNLFVSEDKGLDVHFPGTGQRIPLVRGTVLVFDTGQPHAVIPRGSTGFDPADFPPGRDGSQVFLTWELPITNSNVGRVLGVEMDTDPATALRLEEQQVWCDGVPSRVCAETGQWCNLDEQPCA